MSDLSEWQEHNDAYLSASLAWLRLRLEMLAEKEGGALTGPRLIAPPQPTTMRKTSWLRRVMRSLSRWLSGHADPNVPAHPWQTVTAEMLTDAESQMRAEETRDTPPALIILGQRFGLSRFESQLLLLCAATGLDTQIPSLCARAQGDAHRPYPTFALAFSLFEEPAWDTLSPESRLRYWKLLSVDQSDGQPLISSPLLADQRIVDYVKGLNYLDSLLAPLTSPLDVDASESQLAPSQKAVADKIVSFLRQHPTTEHLPVVQLLGPDRHSKQLVAWQAAARLGLHLYRMPADLLPAHVVELDDLARLWVREGLLAPIALYLDAPDVETGPEGGALSLGRFMAKRHGIIFLDTRDVWSGLAHATAFDVSKPTPAEQEEAWATALGESAGASPELLAGQFNLNLPLIRQIAHTALAEEDSDVSLHGRLWNACLLNTRPHLDVLAQRLEPKATWDDIVLTPNECALLRQIAAQVRNRRRVYDDGGFRQRMNRGLGIGVLFAGDSGTGKTMAAEVIANELQMDLYRIDLSQVVSKYIGETEKNLRKLFDAAEDGGAILFFDEADSLFGKRSEVKDSHDRYANIEINYLLQRMESFRGLAVLATNMKSALDTAFLRRLRFIVDFPYPSLAERMRIWQKAFPPETRVDTLDWDRLAKLNLTGGGIHNIALNAAFLAAEAKTSVTMQQVLDAAKAEFRKSEKPITEGTFRV